MKNLYLSFAFILFYFVAQGQQLSVGLMYENQHSNLNAISKEIKTIYKGNVLSDYVYTQSDIDTLNLFHNYQNTINSSGFQLNYDLKQNESSKWKVSLNTNLGISYSNFFRENNYSDNFYTNDINYSEYRIKSETPGIHLGLGSNIRYFISPKVSVLSVISTNYDRFSQKEIDVFNESRQDEFNYSANYFRNSIGLLCDYSFKKFNFFAGPTFYHNYLSSKEEFKTNNLELEYSNSEIFDMSFKSQSFIMFTAGADIELFNKMKLQCKASAWQNNFSVLAGINYYFNTNIKNQE